MVLIVVVLLATAFVPRTIASGGGDGQEWRLRAAPGIVSPSLRFEWSEGDERLGGYGPTASIDETVVRQIPADDPVVTIVAGPTPRGANSIRVSSDRGVGEAAVRRVLWRRVHVAVLPADVWVRELVAIDGHGQVLEVASELPPPLS